MNVVGVEVGAHSCERAGPRRVAPPELDLAQLRSCHPNASAMVHLGEAAPTVAPVPATGAEADGDGSAFVLLSSEQPSASFPVYAVSCSVRLLHLSV